jgi:hypothetical protein
VDLIPYLSAVILISTVATILLAVISYAAFKLRDKRRPKAKTAEAPRFFHRYRNEDELDPADAADGATGGGSAA